MAVEIAVAAEETVVEEVETVVAVELAAEPSTAAAVVATKAEAEAHVVVAEATKIEAAVAVEVEVVEEETSVAVAAAVEVGHLESSALCTGERDTRSQEVM